MKKLVTEWQRLLDEQKQACPRCGSTEQEAEKAVRELNQLLHQSEIVVNLVKKAIDAVSFKEDVLQSNKILIAGKTLEEWIGPKPAKANAVKPVATRNAERLITMTRPMKRCPPI